MDLCEVYVFRGIRVKVMSLTAMKDDMGESEENKVRAVACLEHDSNKVNSWVQ